MKPRWNLARILVGGALMVLLAACGGTDGTGNGGDNGAGQTGTTVGDRPVETTGPGGPGTGDDGPAPGDVVVWDGDRDAEIEPGTVILLPVHDPFIADLDIEVRYLGFVFALEDLEIDYYWVEPSSAQRIETATYEVSGFLGYEGGDLPYRRARGTVNVSVTNLGPETLTPGPRVLVEWSSELGDQVVIGGSDFPPLPGFGTVRGTMGFSLSANDLETWTTDTAVFALGDVNFSRVTVPLGSRGDLVTRMALRQELTSELVLDEEWLVEVNSLTVQWEDDRFRPTNAGTAVIVVEYTVVESVSTFQRCTGSNSHYGLTLPWGGTLAASARVPGATFCVPPGGSRDGRLVYFTVGDQDDFTGTYTFAITQWGGGSSELVVSLP